MHTPVPVPLSGEPPPTHARAVEPHLLGEGRRLPSELHNGHQQSSIANGQDVAPTDRPQSPRVDIAPGGRSGSVEDAAQLAQSTVAAWQAIDAALGPVIGQRGVAALVRRSLHLTSASHPWMAGTQDRVDTAIDLAGLEALLAQQDVGNAAAGGRALVQTFRGLLATLIGAALTERLLGSLGIDSLSGSPAQDNPP